MTPGRFKVLIDPTDPHATRVQHAVAAVLNPVADAVLTTPLGGAAPPPWQKLQIQTGWGSPISGTTTPQYHVDALNYLHAQGSISNTTGAPSVAIITNLPKGFRPKSTLVIAVAGGAAATQQYLIITAKGDVAPGNNVAAGDWIGFSFSFLAEQ